MSEKSYAFQEGAALRYEGAARPEDLTLSEDYRWGWDNENKRLATVVFVNHCLHCGYEFPDLFQEKHRIKPSVKEILKCHHCNSNVITRIEV